MKVSIAMPVFNGERSLRRTLESLLKSELDDFEIIVSDDCSSDRSIQIVQSIKDSRLKIYPGEYSFSLVVAYQ